MKTIKLLVLSVLSAFIVGCPDFDENRAKLDESVCGGETAVYHGATS
jgi:hypothetical protein